MINIQTLSKKTLENASLFIKNHLFKYIQKEKVE